MVVHTLIPGLGRLKQENHKFKTSLDARSCPKTNKTTQKQKIRLGTWLKW
jgi:hypothetical protein